MWIDAGPGSLAELLRHTTLDRLDAVWISHLHLDHMGDLLSAYYALAYGELPARETPLPVYAPAALETRLTAFFGHLEPDVLSFRPLSDGHHVELRDLSLVSRAVDHGTEAYALRAEISEHSLTYSGDCAPCPALDDLAVNTDLLLCEANDPHPTPVHHTPHQAGALARRTNAKRLVITHVGPLLTVETATTQAAKAFPGRTTLAQVGATLEFSA